MATPRADFEPVAFLVISSRGPRKFVSPSDFSFDGVRDDSLASVTSLYTRDQIAPLRVPIVDQNGVLVGWSVRKPEELLREEAWSDEHGHFFRSQSAWEYFALCQERNGLEERCKRAEVLIAHLLDGEDHRAAAKEFLKECSQ